MIETLSIARYRKLKDIELSFIPGVNILSGTNGTCKSSILHIISNSFQAVTKSCERMTDSKCLSCINKINRICNPKIESLTRGDKKHNDPALGHKGELYSGTLTDGKKFSFRRHNSPKASRYGVKPPYKAGKNESLYSIPVIYLGLFRLFPYGEFQQDDRTAKISKTLPPEYLAAVARLYKNFTGFDIAYTCQQNMGDIKTRAEFSTDHEGIDSNTVSAGEDNLFIILTALVSLKYYYDSIESEEEGPIESILLIDELDASLHPAFQIKLLELFQEYSVKYKVQFVFSTHSFSLLKEAFKNKCNVIYLMDYVDHVAKMEDADIFKIEMNLQQKLRKDMYFPSKIPIFSEDDEARCVISEIFDYFCSVDTDGFAKVRSFFHFVEASIGSKHLKAIFEDKMLLRSTLRSICIVDGDVEPEKKDLNNCIMVLPGKATPEKFVIEYARKLYNENTNFWKASPVVSQGYTLQWCRDHFLINADDIEAKIQILKDNDESTHGVRRKLSKDFFQEYIEFIQLLLRDWLHSDENSEEIYTFYSNLWILFKKVSEFHGMLGVNWVKAESLG